MRKGILAIAAAGSVFALTAAGAGAAGLFEPADKTVNLKSLAKQTVTLNDCKATSVSIAYNLETSEASADFGKVVSADVTVTGTASADLTGCGYVALSLDGTTYLTPVAFGSVTGDGPYAKTKNVTFTATDSVASTVRAIITPDNPVV